MTRPKENAHILLAFPESTMRDEIEKLLHHTSFAELWDQLLLTDVPSIPLAQRTLSEEEVDVCIIGPQFGEEEQDFLIRSVVKRIAPGRTLMIPISVTDDRNALLRYIQAGAHGILVAPVTLDNLHKVLHSAFKSHSESEHLASLPFLLEHVASRLQGLAEKIRERDPSGDVEASSKLIKEALLGVIGSGSHDDDPALERIAEFLLKSAKQDGNEK